VVEGVQDKEIGFVRAFLFFAHFLSFLKKLHLRNHKGIDKPLKKG
jgi:hypothetical protein